MNLLYRAAILAAAPAVVLGGVALSATAAQAAPVRPAVHSVVHPNATTACAESTDKCVNISNLLLNQDNAPSLVVNATRGQVTPGRRLNLRQDSDTRTNEDFIVNKVGTIGQLCPNIIFPVPGSNSLDPTSYACLNYPHFYPVFQANFAPNSNETGLCIGALGAVQGWKVRLVRCGDPRSFWIGDINSTEKITITFPGGVPHVLVYFPLEFAADRSASNPLVATFLPDSTRPRNHISLQQENESGGHVIDRQEWTFTNVAGFTPTSR